MPQSYIREIREHFYCHLLIRLSGANVGKAMKACNPEGGKLLHHRNKVAEIREFPDVGYCDVSGMIGKLRIRGEFEPAVVIHATETMSGKMGHVEVFTTEGNSFSTDTGGCHRSEDPNDEKLFFVDVPDADAFMTSMHGILARFINVLIPVVEVYGLPLTVLHVFYDVAGGPIAFNRDGSIFLNLRYFEAWRECYPGAMADIALILDTPDDQDVQKGNPQQAQISWCVLSPYVSFSSGIDKIALSRFFALAHELAHNLIKQHNSEHEFWFAAICEARVLAFSRLLKYTPV